MKMKKIKTVQIGWGHDHALAVWECLKRNADVFETAGYYIPETEKDKFPDRAAAFGGLKRYGSEEEIFRDPTVEAVVVETEEAALTRYALAAVRAGRHVHMDKPGGFKAGEFDALVSAVKERKTAFSLGYMYRYNPFVREAIERVRRGELGEIFSVEAQMNCFHPPEKRQWLSAFTGGMMFYLGCHLIDLILQIQGAPEEVIPFNASTGADGVTAEDFGFALLKYPNGVSFAKTCAEERGGFARRRLTITGTKGTIEIDPLEMFEGGGQYAGMRENFSADWGDKGVFRKSAVFDRYDAMMRAFAETARGERENPYSPDYEKLLFHTVLRACGAEENK